MKRRLAFALLLSLAGVLYVASPFWAAWSLREAIKAGDSESIAHRVAWDSVRASLKESLRAQNEFRTSVDRLGATIKPTLWQRVKQMFGATMLDRFVETYVTPEGLPRLQKYRETLDKSVQGQVFTPKQKTWTERLGEFYSRIKRAEFTGLTRVEFEVASKYRQSAHFLGTFELRGLSWQLTELRIKSSSPESAPKATQARIAGHTGTPANF